MPWSRVKILLDCCKAHRREYRDVVEEIGERIKNKRYVGSMFIMPKYYQDCLKERQHELLEIRMNRREKI